jgi:Family of unknown function (DUF5994)
MLSAIDRKTAISLSPPSTPRLRLQPLRTPCSPCTLLDGGWWPRSADPVAELPGLVLALDDAFDDRYSPIWRIMLGAAEWHRRPRRLLVDGPAGSRVVRLGWFDTMPAGLLTAICSDRQRIDLLTVPPKSSAAAAQKAMEQAARPGNLTHTPDILSTTRQDARTHQTEAETAPESLWESEGGRLKGRPAAHGR